MAESGRPTERSFHRQLRTLRRAQDLTLQQVAEQTGLSRGFLSQIESGQATPSLASLTRIAAALGVSVHQLLGEAAPPAPDASLAPLASDPALTTRRPVISTVSVVRHDRRKQIVWPGWTVRSSLLTPDFQRQLQALLDELEPGAEQVQEAGPAEGEVFGWLLAGRCRLEVAEQAYTLEAGDAISLPSRLAVRVVALDDVPARWLWVRTPPTL